MDAVIEVGVMTAVAELVTPLVMAFKRFSSQVQALVTQTSTSILRSLRIGRSSISAVPGDNNFMKGGLAVFA
jgi:hypothetical protein